MFDLEVDLGGAVGETSIADGTTFRLVQGANLLDPLARRDSMGDPNDLTFRHSDIGVTVVYLASFADVRRTENLVRVCHCGFGSIEIDDGRAFQSIGAEGSLASIMQSAKDVPQAPKKKRGCPSAASLTLSCTKC